MHERPADQREYRNRLAQSADTGAIMKVDSWSFKKKCVVVAAALGAVLTASSVLIGTDAANEDQRRAPGGEVRRVSGDRIKLKDGRDIEFAAIRLPFEHEPYADKARHTLEKWVNDEGVRLAFDDEWGINDDRLLAYVYANDTFINERLVRAGLAFVKLRAGNRKYEAVLLKAQAEAREERNGMWTLLKATSGVPFVGDEERATFHRPECAKRPGESKAEIQLKGSAEALERGMAPCGKCRPMD